MAGATLQVLLISVAVGALAYWSGRRSGLERAELERQQGRMTLLSSQLSSRLAAPRSINSLNVAMIREGLLNLNDFNARAGHLRAQMPHYQGGYCNNGTTAGQFSGGEPPHDGKPPRGRIPGSTEPPRSAPVSAAARRHGRRGGGPCARPAAATTRQAAAGVRDRRPPRPAR